MEEQWLEALQSEDTATRDLASQQLWEAWFMAKGEQGLAQINAAQLHLEAGDLVQALAILTELIVAMPDFAEAWNRRAVIYFLQGNYDLARADCERVISLIPYHFGALHGLGLCHMAQRNYAAAQTAFRQALAIQPHAIENQRFLLECTARLS